MSKCKKIINRRISDFSFKRDLEWGADNQFVSQMIGAINNVNLLDAGNIHHSIHGGKLVKMQNNSIQDIVIPKLVDNMEKANEIMM